MFDQALPGLGNGAADPGAASGIRARRGGAHRLGRGFAGSRGRGRSGALAAMHEWLVRATEYSVLFIDAIALLIVVIASVEAFINGMRLMVGRPDGHERREVWVRFARWLVAALAFQLAGDLSETWITAEWLSVGPMGRS